ncbi:hypothetical protein H4582DRAFT_2127840 [Lactarius indigo]|nr:hypothetical protein H4582DRAFT_2127840 [Lactarius indigo]
MSLVTCQSSGIWLLVLHPPFREERSATVSKRITIGPTWFERRKKYGTSVGQAVGLIAEARRLRLCGQCTLDATATVTSLVYRVVSSLIVLTPISLAKFKATMPPVVQECPICLDGFRDPVVTPCAAEPAWEAHVRASRDPYEATCPTCRAPFPIGDGEDTSRALIDDLNTEITLLKARVGTLRRDKDLLMDRCEAAQSAVSRLTSDERDARLELVKAKEEARIANESFESLKVVYHSLESIHLDCPPDTKRKSGQAALDSSSSIDSHTSSPRRVKVSPNGRPVKPMPKRARLQQTTTGPTTQNTPTHTTTSRFADLEVVFRPSVSFSSPSSFPSSSSSAPASTSSALTYTRSGPSATTARRTRVARYTTSSDESDGHSDVDDPVPRYRIRSRITYPRIIEHTAPPTPVLMRIVRQRPIVG